MKYAFIQLFFVFLTILPGLSQEEKVDTINRQLVKYDPDFRFQDGIYLNFDQVKNNNPVPKYKIISSVDANDPDFFESVSNENVVSYYDELGIRQDVQMKKVWGYCKNGMPYIRMSDTYNKISIIGNICHFVANITVSNSRNYDPYYYNPYYYNRYYGASPTYSTSEMRQFILDFDSGKIYDYEEDSMEVLLMKDPELHDEYMALSKKKRQQMKFYYIRKFNERHPLMIPN